LEGSAFDFSLSCFAVCLLIKTAGLGAGSADWLETATSGLGAGWLGIVVSELDAGCLSVVGSFLGAFAASFTVSSGGLLKMSLVSAGCLGDSGIGSLTNSFLAGFASSSGEAAADLSGRESDSASVSLLIRRRETLDSWLGSRCKPMRPSFSTATKLVRTLDSGRGEPVPCGPGQTSAVSVWCSAARGQGAHANGLLEDVCRGKGPYQTGSGSRHPTFALYLVGWCRPCSRTWPAGS
jgi:hypothetical protein